MKETKEKRLNATHDPEIDFAIQDFIGTIGKTWMSSKVWFNNILMLIFYYVGIGVMEENVFICREYTLKYSVKSGHYIGNFPLSGPEYKKKKKKPNLLLFSKFMIVSKKLF